MLAEHRDLRHGPGNESLQPTLGLGDAVGVEPCRYGPDPAMHGKMFSRTVIIAEPAGGALERVTDMIQAAGREEPAREAAEELHIPLLEQPRRHDARRGVPGDRHLLDPSS